MKTKLKLTPGRIVTALLWIAGIAFLIWRAGWYNEYVANLPEWVIENAVVKEYNGNSEHIAIGHGIEHIGSSAFSNHDEIKTVELPNSVLSIDRDAFRFCYGLEEINFPADLKEIGPLAFYGAKSLGHVEFPEGLRTINFGAFHTCESMTFDSLPQSLTGIGAEAFKNCKSLTAVEIPSGVFELYESTFENCPSLVDVYIPDTVRKIDYFAFAGSDNVVIHCTYGSEAERFAKEAGLPMVYDMPTVNTK